MVIGLVSTISLLTISPAADAQVFPSCLGQTFTILGTDGDDIIDGTPGNDVIVALGGTDQIHAGFGDDVVCGDDGNDIISGATATISCQAGSVSIT